MVQERVCMKQSRKVFTRLNRPYTKNVGAVYSVSLFDPLQFLVVSDASEMGRRCQWNGRHLVRIDLVSIDDVCARVIRQRNHLSCQAGGTTNRHAQLQTAATLEGLGKM